MITGMGGAEFPADRDYLAEVLPEENVIVTPHIGGVTVESYAKMAAAFAASVREVLAVGECRGRSG